MKNIRKLCALMMALILMTVCMSMVSASEASSEGAEGDILQLDMEVGLDAKGSILYYEEVYVIPQDDIHEWVDFMKTIPDEGVRFRDEGSFLEKKDM